MILLCKAQAVLNSLEPKPRFGEVKNPYSAGGVGTA